MYTESLLLNPFMRNIRTLSITEARKIFFKIATDVQTPETYYTLTENGKAKAVILSVEEFESMQETLEVLRDIPDLDRSIKEFEADLKSGAYKNYPTLEEVIQKHAISDKTKAKSRKKAK